MLLLAKETSKLHQVASCPGAITNYPDTKKGGKLFLIRLSLPLVARMQTHNIPRKLLRYNNFPPCGAARRPKKRRGVKALRGNFPRTKTAAAAGVLKLQRSVCYMELIMPPGVMSLVSHFGWLANEERGQRSK